MRTVGELLSERASFQLFGRGAELDHLLEVLAEDGPLIVFVTGLGGIGKSCLLQRFGELARSSGATVIAIDCAVVEPTPQGVLGAVATAAGSDPSRTSVVDRLGGLSRPVVLVLDDYDRFRLVDAWIRQELVPCLPGNVRVVAAGRERPSPAWRPGAGADAAVRLLELRPLGDRAAGELLRSRGVPEASVAVIASFARGHPLALTIAAASSSEQPDLPAEATAIPAVVAELTSRYLVGMEPATREVLDAASLVRRTTLPLLRAMIPGVAPQDGFERLKALPFVTLGADGLALHETMQHPIAAALQAADPARARRLRIAAWRQLRGELIRAGRGELWRFTADMLWLINNPVVREAFFPSAGSRLAVEGARPEDGPAIVRIIQQHETPSMVDLACRWWHRRPDSFRVARNSSGQVVGCYWMLQRTEVPRAWLDEHPVTAAWLEDLRRRPVGPRRRTLLLFRWLDREAGELPSASQGAMWLDIKRSYVELRPDLDRLYTVVRDVHAWAPVVTPLGFVPLPEAVVVDGVPAYPVVLDFGPGSVDGWFARLAAAELGVVDVDPFDPDNHCVRRLDGEAVGLSPLETALLAHLLERRGTGVTRAELISKVWGTEYTGGSNVVDSAVRTLRRKLEGTEIAVDTVRGVGYRATDPSSG